MLTGGVSTIALSARLLHLPVQVQHVRICSCVIPVMFTVYLCSVTVHSCLNWAAIVIVDCSCNALLRSTATTRVHYEYTVYSGIHASVCPLVVMYVGTPCE